MKTKKQPSSYIHILCCTDSHYCPYTGVMLTSLLENNRQHYINIWIATTDSNPDNLHRLSALCKTYDCSIHFIHICQEEIDALPEAQGRWPKEAYLRLTALKSLPQEVTKILYIDGDIIVNTDIGPLWSRPLDDKAVVAIPDINEYIFDNRARLNIGSPYFNSGVMVMDIDRCRQLDMTNRCIEIISNNRLDYPDQDALNIVLDGHVSYASQRWNLVDGYLRTVNRRHLPHDVRSLVDRLTAGRRKAIIHYTGVYKPWRSGTFMFHPLHAIWRKYHRLSAWSDTPIIETTQCTTFKTMLILRMKMCNALGIGTNYNHTWSVTSGRYSSWRSSHV